MKIHKYLNVFLLIVAMLLVSFNSFAHDTGSGIVNDSCACHLPDFSADTGNTQPDHAPDSQTDDCCDCEGCCPDATEPAMFSGLRLVIFTKQHFQPYINSYPPEVIQAIFVPPESCSLT